MRSIRVTARDRTERPLLGGFAIGTIACIAVIPALMWWVDQPVILWAAAHRERTAWKLAKLISLVGGWTPHALLLGTLVTSIALGSGRRLTQRFFVCLVAVALAGMTTECVRIATGRARPMTSAWPGWYGPRHDGHWTIGRYKFSSFPSAHTAVVFAAAIPILLERRRAGRVALAGATIVAASRIYLHAHHVSDVAAGILFGSGCGLYVARDPRVLELLIRLEESLRPSVRHSPWLPRLGEARERS